MSLKENGIVSKQDSMSLKENGKVSQQCNRAPVTEIMDFIKIRIQGSTNSHVVVA